MLFSTDVLVSGDGLTLREWVADDMRTPLGEVLLFEGEPAGTAEFAYTVGLKHRRQGLVVRFDR